MCKWWYSGVQKDFLVVSDVFPVYKALKARSQLFARTDYGQEFERQAFQHAEPFDQRFYTEGKERRGSLFNSVQRRILLGYFGSQSVSA
jgi:hypothetical protein